MSSASKPITLQYSELQSHNESYKTQDDFALYTGCVFGILIESWKIPSHIQDLCKIEMPEDQVKLSFILAEYLEGTVGRYFTNLQFKNIYDEQKLASKTKIDEIIDISWLTHYITSIFPKLEYTVEMEDIQVLELMVVKEFKEVGEVLTIYRDEYRDEIRFTISTSNETYDDELMNRLLEIEYNIRLIFHDSPICFQYIPALYDSIEEILPRQTRLIYMRSESATISGSLTTSRT